MHLHIISAIYGVLLFARGYTEEYKCGINVPQSVQETLIKVINNKCNSGNERLRKDSYDCGLEQKVSAGRPSKVNDPSEHFFFDGTSTFNFNWEESLTGAINDADQRGRELQNPVGALCYLSANKIGCFIDLSTSNDTGIHELKLRCNYGWS